MPTWKPKHKPNEATVKLCWPNGGLRDLEFVLPLGKAARRRHEKRGAIGGAIVRRVQ